MAEAGVGTTMQSEGLSGMDRMRHGLKGASELVADITVGTELKAAKFGMALLKAANADTLRQIGTALKERNVSGADTILIVAEQMERHPHMTALITKRLTQNK